MVFGLKDYIYAAALVVVLGAFGWYTIHERDIGKAHVLEQLQTASAKLQADADAKVAALTAQHVNEIATLKVTYENQHESDVARRDSDAVRLREYDAYRSTHPSVGSAPGGQGNPPVVAGSAVADGDRFERLEQVALGLAAAGRAVSASLAECEIERDSLTEK